MAENSIGILGGTFNPIHNKHLELARLAYEQFDLAKVLIIPSGISYLKEGTGVLPGNIRYEMCSLACECEDYLEVSDIDIKRSGRSYTCDTLGDLLNENPQNTYYYIVGTDSFYAMDTWKDPGYIFKSCIIVVAARGEDTIEEVEHKMKVYEGKYNAAIRILHLTPDTTSSTNIRKMISKGRDVSSYLPDKLIKYIEDNRLYK
ncbi:MAG: nicotinate-nucleotide adenylyltransferase [Lachnospiraceae bacterium]|nr:nicotinate-nucleotide adenylyltransferase [Lachnospiraceae bacterium]